MRILRLAAAVVAVQAVGLLVVAGISAAQATSDRLGAALGTAAFFLLYAVGLAGCSWGLTRAQRWARGPVLLSQLLFALVVWALGSAGVALAIPVTLLSVAGLGLMVHPQAVRALEEGV